MKKNIFIPLLFFIIACCLFSSCNDKKKWKLPTELSTTVNIRNTISPSNNIVFTKGSITLSEFQFDGERDQGEDMFFVKPLEVLNIPFSGNYVNELNFDIPQGTYSKIIISLKTQSPVSAKEDPLNNNHGEGSISIEGTYTDYEGNQYPLYFDLNTAEHFSVIAKSNSGNNQILFDKDVPMTANISFDPVYWFQTISSSMLDEITDEMDMEQESNNNSEAILINKDHNSALYDIIVNRIGNDLSVIIE